MNYEPLIQKAKKEIDNGFNKMGRKIDNPSFLEKYLIVSTLKAVKLSDAIVFLCKNDFNNESLIILRSLIEHSVNMHWIIKDNTKEKLSNYISDLEKINYGERWTDVDLSKRLEYLGFKNRDYYDFVIKFTYSHAHVNAKALDWKEVIKIDGLKAETFSDQAIYSIVAQMLCHVLKSLDMNFNGFFSSYSDIWKEIKVDKSSLRNKIEEMVEKLNSER